MYKKELKVYEILKEMYEESRRRENQLKRKASIESIPELKITTILPKTLVIDSKTETNTQFDIISKTLHQNNTIDVKSEDLSQNSNQLSVIASEVKQNDNCIEFQCNESKNSIELALDLDTHSEVDLDTHSETDQKNIELIECHECQQIFNTKELLSAHISQTHRKVVFKCDSCDYQTFDERVLKRHKRKHSLEDKPFKCDVYGCDERFRTNDCLTRHETQVHFETLFACDWSECEKTFRQKRSLDRHLKVDHLNPITDQTSSSAVVPQNSNIICDKLKLELRVSLVRLENTNELQINNTIDSNAEKSKTKPKSNQKSKTNPLTQNTNNNNKSEEIEKNVQNLSQTTLKSINKSKSTLNTNIIPVIKCEFKGCDKEFGTKGGYNSHKYSYHLGVEYVCRLNWCRKRFNKKYVLKQHLIHHSTNRPYECANIYCAKKFKTQANLNQHKRYVHEFVNRVHCDWSGCESSFQTKYLFQKHWNTFHSNC